MSQTHFDTTAATPLERTLALLIVALMVLGAALSVPSAVLANASTNLRPDGLPPDAGPPFDAEEVISLPVGSGPAEAGLERGEELEPWGPSAFALDELGRFHILDGVNGRTLVIEPDTGDVTPVAWRDPIVCPVDISIASGRTFLLDLPAQPAAVREVDADGHALASWEIPAGYLDHGVSGLDVAIDRTGDPEIRLELSGAWQIPLTGPGSAGLQRLPLVLEGDAMRIPASVAASFATERGAGRAFAIEKEWSTGRSARATAFVNGRPAVTFDVSSSEPLGAVRFVDTDAAGSVFLWSEDLPAEGNKTRAFLKRYAADGTPSAIFEVPVDAFEAHPMRPVRVAPDGNAYLLVPGADRVSILRARWTSDADEALPAIAPGSTPVSHLDSIDDTPIHRALAWIGELFAPESAIASWTPRNGNDRAWTYVNHKWYCNSRNYATRNGSTRPRYITSANRNYTAVPYCWGGFDSITSYNNAMSAGHSAGDINCTGGKRAGTAGVDCSGFVSRLWGLGAKRSTYTLRDVARQVSRTSMKLGDAYIRPGSHCMFFRYYTTGGAQVFESTKTNKYDRTVTMNRTNTVLSNYGAWRYRNW